MTYYAPPDQVDQLDYSVDTGKKILPYFESYYNITYPLPKAGIFWAVLQYHIPTSKSSYILGRYCFTKEKMRKLNKYVQFCTSWAIFSLRITHLASILSNSLSRMIYFNCLLKNLFKKKVNLNIWFNWGSVVNVPLSPVCFVSCSPVFPGAPISSSLDSELTAVFSKLQWTEGEDG